MQFNPYREWLQLELDAPPQDYYQLLGLRRFEGDLDVIRSAVDEKTNRVRHIRPGPHVEVWQQLLDGLAEVRRTMTDLPRKLQYDETLRARLGLPATSATQSTSAASGSADPRGPTTAAAATTHDVAPSLVHNPLPPSLNPLPPTHPAATTIPTPTTAPAPATVPTPAAASMPSLASFPPPAAALATASTAAMSPTGMPGLQPSGMPFGISSMPQAPPGYGPAPLAMAIPLAPAQGTTPPLPGHGVYPGYAPAGYVPASYAPSGLAPSPLTPQPLVPQPMPPQTTAPYMPGAPTAAAPATYPYPAAAPTTTVDPMAPVQVYLPPAADEPALQPLPVGSAVAPASVLSASTATVATVEPAPMPQVSTIRRRRAPSTSLAGVGVACVLVAGGIAIWAIANQTRERELARQQQSVESAADDASAVVHRRDEPRNPRIARRPQPEPGTPLLTEGDPPSIPDDRAPDDGQPSQSQPTPSEPQPPEKQPGEKLPSEKIPSQKMPDKTEEVPAPKESMPKTPMPSTPPPPPPPVTPKQAAPSAVAVSEMLKALAASRQALADRKLDEAKTQVGIAQSLATTKEHKDLVERADLLHHYVSEFWRAVKASMGSLQNVDELEVGNTRVAIVSSSENEIQIRAGGRNRTFETMGVPAGLAMALANRWLDPKSGTTKIIKGAFLAVDPNGDPRDARKMWEESKLLGGDVDHLMPVLDDKYESASLPAARATPRRGSLPTTDAIVAATKQVKQKYAKEIAAANKPELRYNLAKKLVEDAGTELPSDAYRFALFQEAREIAVAARFGQLTMQIVDETAKWFQFDVLSMKYDALAKATVRAPMASGRELSLEALALVEHAVEQKRPELADKLVKLATTAANIAKDRDLARKAVDKGKELKLGPEAKVGENIPTEKSKPQAKAKPEPKDKT